MFFKFKNFLNPSLILLKLLILVYQLSIYEASAISNELFPVLPIVINDSENIFCKNDSELLKINLEKNILWAYQMWESSARDTTGTLYGNLYHLGHFDECLDLSEPIKPQYCLVKLKIILKKNYTVVDRFSLKYRYNETVLENIQYSYDPNKMRRDESHIGLCLPKSCSPKSVENYLQNYLQQNFSDDLRTYHVTVDKQDCYTKEDINFDVNDIFFFLIAAVLLLVVLICTGYDFLKDHQEESAKSKNSRLVLCFSARDNFRQLMKKDSTPLGVMYGLKLFMMVGIIIAHNIENTLFGPVFNIRSIELINRSFFVMPLLRGEIIVDVFFLFSGLLATYTFMIQSEKRNINPGKTILLRYFRLVPAFAFVTFFYATILDKVGSGPMWNRVVSRESEYCQKNWWVNLLMLNNYIDVEHMCMLQTWYICCDFQLFLVGLFINMIIRKNHKIGLSILGLLIGGFTLILFLTVLLRETDPFVFMFNNYFYSMRVNDFFLKVYAPLHTRAAPYFIGMVYGYIYYRIKTSKFQFSKVKSLIICMIYVWVTVGCLFGGMVFYNSNWIYNAFDSAIYAGFHKTFFSIGVGLMLLVLTHGYFDFFGKLLKWKPMVPLGKLTFGAYMTHMVFQLIRVGATRVPVKITVFSWMSTGTNDLILANISAFVLFIFVENPFSRLVKEILPKDKNQNQTDKPEINKKSSDVNNINGQESNNIASSTRM